MSGLLFTRKIYSLLLIILASINIVHYELFDQYLVCMKSCPFPIISIASLQHVGRAFFL